MSPECLIIPISYTTDMQLKHFYQFSSCYILPSITTSYWLLLLFTTTYQLLLPFANFCQLFITLCKLYQLLLNFVLLFINQRNGSVSFFSSSDLHQPHHLVTCHATGIVFAYLFLIWCVIFKSIMLSNKSNMSNSNRITLIKIINIKVNIVKVYNIMAHTITRGCNRIRVYIIKFYIIIREYNIRFFKHFARNKPIRNKIWCW